MWNRWSCQAAWWVLTGRWLIGDACQLQSWWEEATAREGALLRCQQCLPVVLQSIYRRMAGHTMSIMLHLCKAQRSTQLEPLLVCTSSCPAVPGGSCAQAQPPHLQSHLEISPLCSAYLPDPL